MHVHVGVSSRNFCKGGGAGGKLFAGVLEITCNLRRFWAMANAIYMTVKWQPKSKGGGGGRGGMPHFATP